MNRGMLFQINASRGGVPKLPLREGMVTAAGLVGDSQADTVHHGGPERILCLYSLERILDLQREGHPISPGSAGENLTLAGLDWNEMLPGTRWRIGGELTIEVTKYCTPCKNLVAFFREGEFNRIHQEKHRGWSRVYAKVITPGRIMVGEPVQRLG